MSRPPVWGFRCIVSIGVRIPHESSATAVVSDLLIFVEAEDGIRLVAVTGVQTCALLICLDVQAEDGIRDVAVTGVQTCALPI
mgnify:CR=1 FL=1